MNETQAREKICQIGASLFSRGYVHATAGNISYRLDDGFLITPTDASLGTLEPQQIARVDLNGQVLGSAKPSKTLKLHQHIYNSATQQDTNTRCIIHTHSTYCVALTMQPIQVKGQLQWIELLPPITPYFVMKVGHVPLMPYKRPGAPETAKQVAQAIADYARAGAPIRAVMLSRLGPNVWGDTPESAMATLEELEETAKLWHLSQPKPLGLHEQALKELRDVFGARW